MSALCPKADILRGGKNDAISITSLRALPSFDAGGLLSALHARIEQIGPRVVAREDQKLSVDWVWYG